MACSAAARLANQNLLLVAHVCLLKPNGGEVHGVFLNLSLELLDLGHIIAVHICLEVLQLGTSTVLVLQPRCNLDRPAESQQAASAKCNVKNDKHSRTVCPKQRTNADC